jgi:hypothetical protein
LRGTLARLYASLGLGLALWFVADAIWVYYEVVAFVETPFPSIADGFWILGYVPVFYFLIGMLKHFLKLTKAIVVPLLIASFAGIVFVGNALMYTYSQADFTSFDGSITFIVSSAYPVADIFLLIPAVAAFIRLRKGLLTFAPWVAIVTAMILFIVADTGFAYFVMGGMDDLVWMWSPLYQIAYLAIASSLFWYRKFFTVDEKKLLNQWKEQNR